MDEQHAFLAETDSAQRLDVWLTERLPACSRARLQKLIRDGLVLVDGRTAREHRRLQRGQRVTVTIPAPKPIAAVPEPLPLAILYQDQDIIVIDKSPGTVVHPSAGHDSGTLVNALLHHCPGLTGIGGEVRPGIVHRLDRDTSGVMVVAKNEPAMHSLSAQFKQRLVKKEYLALVWGVPPTKGSVDAPIGRHPIHRKQMALTARGRPAQTSFEREECFGLAALLRVRIHTGRTHQIRVHLAHLGHPVLGDSTYGRRSSRALPLPPARQMLHAARLDLVHPTTGAPLTFEAPLPADMRTMLEALRALQPGSI
ncbi:MAG: RluA family pseudouridine synthase [Kiritimatiellia bacterium]|nr:RluA family pseudouridine synthase [Lentisphaerota bacterium]